MKDLPIDLSTGAGAFFIVGSPKSGTTYLRNLADAHPQCVCVLESYIFLQLCADVLAALRAYNHRSLPHRQQVFAEFSVQANEVAMTEQEVHDILRILVRRLFLRAAASKPEAIRFGEKTPGHIVEIENIHRLLPQAKFIRVIRDPRDVLVSDWNQALRIDRADKESGQPVQQNGELLHQPVEYAWALAKRWDYANSRFDEFQQRLPALTRTYRYEDLMASPHAIGANMFDFLELPADSSVTQRCVDASAFERYSGGRPRGQLSEASFLRSGMVRQWDAHFSKLGPDAYWRFISLCQQTMRRHGYEPELQPQAHTGGVPRPFPA